MAVKRARERTSHDAPVVFSAPNPLVVSTHASGPHLELLAMSRPSITGYAGLHNWELIVDTDPSLSAGREAAWGKIVLICRLLESNEWVLWLDCDLFVVQPEYRILEETNVDKDLYLVEGLAKGHRYPYAGVMLVRSTPWSRDFFRRVWDHPGGRFAENTAIADMLGYQRGCFEPTPDKSKVSLLPVRWHSLSRSAGADPIFVHFAGVKKKAHAMRWWLKRSKRLRAQLEASGGEPSVDA
jgi:hypothetical protein